MNRPKPNSKTRQTPVNQSKTGLASAPLGSQNKFADPHVQINAWHEVCKTIRWAICGVTIVGGLAVLTWGVVAVNTKDAPWWKVLLFTAAPPVSIVGTAILLLKKQVTKKISELSTRNRNLELSVDATRNSSELLNDGTHPHDD